MDHSEATELRRRIYLSPPHMSEEGYEIEFVMEAFESNWIAPLGPQVDKFEEEFAAWNNIDHAAALSSGTAALHLALVILKVERGDEVLCSTLTFCASANPIVYLGAAPVFIDSDERTWNMDPNLLEAELKRRVQRRKAPKAVMAVDIYGQCADYDPIVEICERYSVPLIEDAAEALGATYKGVKAGNFGRMAIYSFNGNKIITTSGGGMLTSSDEAVVKEARSLSTQARDADYAHHQHSRIGYNYRMSNILAAIGRGQLRKLDDRIQRRKQIFETYRGQLGEMSGISFMPEPEGFVSTHWLTCMLIDQEIFGVSREKVRLTLAEHNIESRPLWMPMHMQPVFKDADFVGSGVSERLFRDGLCLPSGSDLTDEEIGFICRLIRSLFSPF